MSKFKNIDDSDRISQEFIFYVIRSFINKKNELTRQKNKILNNELYLEDFYNDISGIMIEFEYSDIKETPAYNFFMNLSSLEKRLVIYRLRGYKLKEIALLMNMNDSTIQYHSKKIRKKALEKL